MVSPIYDWPGSLGKRWVSPLGALWLVASESELVAVLWEEGLSADECAQLERCKASQLNSVLKNTVRQLKEYFAGRRKRFDLPIRLQGTSFQKTAWRELLAVPYGHKISYREQAQRLGDAKKARAVGGANARNPICVIVPCHRVVASSGALSGYAGTPGIKAKLLDLEAQAVGLNQFR